MLLQKPSKELASGSRFLSLLERKPDLLYLVANNAYADAQGSAAAAFVVASYGKRRWGLKNIQ